MSETGDQSRGAIVGGIALGGSASATEALGVFAMAEARGEGGPLTVAQVTACFEERGYEVTPAAGGGGEGGPADKYYVQGGVGGPVVFEFTTR
ncbi:MAG: hypothetical protein HYS86_03350 [Candidatus Chisholmbacteria bacterium]|nr:hypothetical protein [Candidatus Chisholmbacteria bacterium]